MARAFDGSVLVGPYDESSTSSSAAWLTRSNTTLQLKDRYSVESNLVNNQVLTVNGFGVAFQNGIGSTGRLDEVGSDHIDYQTYNDMCNSDIADSRCRVT
jgi:hypothetical protein